jgi:type III pantothenate kinase
VSVGRVAAGAPLDALPEAPASAAVSVNPPALARLRARLPGLRVLGEEIPIPIAVRYDPPGACGPDRVAGVLGALHLEAAARAVLVVDFGTCVTLTAGDRDAGVLGGAILPGPELQARALHEHTRTLPLVDPLAPGDALGRSTAESIRSGVWFGVAGAVRELVGRIARACPRSPRVVAAGTGAAAFAPLVPEVEAVHPHATLWGVYVAARRP